jgi:hypothetical protein
MVFYHLSGAQILRIFRKPARREEGIAANTVAAMQSKNSKQQKVNSKQRSEEIWIMYKLNSLKANSSKPRPNGRQVKASRITLISAWRYPGVTKPGERPPIPEDVAEMLEKGIY